jgi:hypothetical protein
MFVSHAKAPLPKKQGLSILFVLFLLFAIIFASMLGLMATVNKMKVEILPDALEFSIAFSQQQNSLIVPIDLSVNNLQVIQKACGTLENQSSGAAEDFLPIVLSNTWPMFRFRLKPAAGACPLAIRDISAYRIVAQHAHNMTVLWDSGKIIVTDSMPHSIPWGGCKLISGMVIKWKALVWDSTGMGPSKSQYSKFGVGPSNDGWTGQWIAHPYDVASYKKIMRSVQDSRISREKCAEWKGRRPLPLVRAKLQLSDKEASLVGSALLIVSGLGSFATTLDGMSLSSSSVLDPPLTDFSQRVSYRGYDITKHFQTSSTHVVGITLGSGWWDCRPMTSSGGLIKLNILPQGPLAAIAELHLTFHDGSFAVKIPTGNHNWEIAKGFIRDSDLFTGDTVDLGTFEAMQGWDSPQGWNEKKPSIGAGWVKPVLYHSDISLQEWREALSEKAGANDQNANDKRFSLLPIGNLVPLEIPPVLPIEQVSPESVVHLGGGRWLFDFGKAMSGVLRFEEGLPNPIVPESEGKYPRSHNVLTNADESFVTVVYGDSIQMETGDINLILVAGMGLHDGGPRKKSRRSDYNTQKAGGLCFPLDHGMVLTQRDVFLAPKHNPGLFSLARQSLFTSHGFRFAELCCVEKPPKNVHAVAYRSAFQEWGFFDSSNVLLNGAYELTKNALNSNMLGTQTDCPHRERLQYGGDIVANSPAAMHFFDLSAFYAKIIHDWTDTQWKNGAYTETSIWQDLNDDRGVGHGAGETVWASLPPVLTVRHMQHYADKQLAEESFEHHVEWLEFLKANWNAGMYRLFYERLGKDLSLKYMGGPGGLGDWIALRTRDTWLTHNAFYMASARAIVYLAARLEAYSEIGKSALALANEIKDDINALYMANNDFQIKNNTEWTPGPEMGLFTRIVPGTERCTILKKWICHAGSEEPVTWPGDEEQRFFRHLNNQDLDDMIKHKKVKRNGIDDKGEECFRTIWRRRHHTPEGILSIRYSLKTLSDIGFHNIALSKVTGDGFPSFEYMLSHNATTLWETWWRSEDVYSRNHPMLGAISEWAVSSVAGVSLAPTTIGGKELLFWPRVPKSAVIVQYASASQGTKRGDAAIAWEFLGLPKNKTLLDSGVVEVHIRILVPPSSVAILRLPCYGNGVSIKYAQQLPNLEKAKSDATVVCTMRRSAGMGFHYNWEYNKVKQEWSKFYNKKSIGTPCKSYLFTDEVSQAKWSPSKLIHFKQNGNDTEVDLDSGLYDVIIDHWQLLKETEDMGIHKMSQVGSQCSDSSTFMWEKNDATHLI